jgi:hypothetical protein
VAVHTATRVVSREISAIDGALVLSRLVWDEASKASSEVQDRLLPFLGLRREWEEWPDRHAELEEAIRREAEVLIESWAHQ